MLRRFKRIHVTLFSVSPRTLPPFWRVTDLVYHHSNKCIKKHRKKNGSDCLQARTNYTVSCSPLTFLRILKCVLNFGEIVWVDDIVELNSFVPETIILVCKALKFGLHVGF